jgi:hypothetical protein
MVDQKDPNKKHYFQLASHEEFTESIQMQCTLNEAPPITIWEKGEDEDHAELYQPVQYFPHPRILKLKATGKLLTQITGSLKAGKQVLVKIPIEDKVNYFASGRLTFDPNEMIYSLEMAQEIYKSQARGNYRLNASKVIPIQFKIDNQVFDALDVSASGTSFSIDPSEAERFAKGKVFPDCTLRFDRKNYHIPVAQIAIHLPLNDESGNLSSMIKVGIAFKDLPRKIEDELYIKISTEARGEEMKKKFDTILAKKTGDSK